MSDISELKKLEKDLLESREKYQTLVDNINDIVFELDNQGVFEYISPSVEKIT